jgi:F-type H+-transporting ATPase subunit b
MFFASEEAAGSPLAALGVDGKSLIFQLITFVLVFLILKKFAFGPISKMLAERRKTIDEGVKAGLEYEKARAKLDKEHERIVREAHVEADKIVGNANKEAREVVREAEKTAQRKAESVLTDAEARIHEEQERAKRSLEKDIIGLVSDATEAIVGEKIDAKKDGEIIRKLMNDRAA